MRILVADDTIVNQKVLCGLLSPFGACDIASDGTQAVEAVQRALTEGRPYGLICLDIMMPKLDGQGALTRIRDLEQSMGVPVGMGARILMITTADDRGQILKAFRNQCDGYMVKPVTRDTLLEQLRHLDLA